MSVLLRDRHHKGPTEGSLQMGKRSRIKGSRPLELVGKQVSIALGSWYLCSLVGRDSIMGGLSLMTIPSAVMMCEAVYYLYHT